MEPPFAPETELLPFNREDFTTTIKTEEGKRIQSPFPVQTLIPQAEKELRELPFLRPGIYPLPEDFATRHRPTILYFITQDPRPPALLADPRPEPNPHPGERIFYLLPEDPRSFTDPKLSPASRRRAKNEDPFFFHVKNLLQPKPLPEAQRTPRKAIHKHHRHPSPHRLTKDLEALVVDHGFHLPIDPLTIAPNEPALQTERLEAILFPSEEEWQARLEGRIDPLTGLTTPIPTYTSPQEARARKQALRRPKGTPKPAAIQLTTHQRGLEEKRQQRLSLLLEHLASNPGLNGTQLRTFLRTLGMTGQNQTVEFIKKAVEDGLIRRERASSGPSILHFAAEPTTKKKKKNKKKKAADS